MTQTRCQTMNRTKVAVIGCGHLGTIHARLLAAREDVELVAVVDPSAASRDRVAQSHGCRAIGDPYELVGLVAAAIVAAPTGLHAAVSLPLLEAGLDLLIEKPIAASVEDARAIVAMARRHARVVAVGHVERFNPAWQMAVARAGCVVSLESARMAPFSFRSMDVGVVHDLLIHDIDLVLSLNPGRLDRVDAHGLIATGGHEDAVRARLVFSSGLVADLSASRIHPAMERRVTLWSSDAIIAVDFNAKSVEVVAPSDAVRSGRFVAADVPMDQRAGLKSPPMCRWISVQDSRKNSSSRSCTVRRWRCQKPMRSCASTTIFCRLSERAVRPRCQRRLVPLRWKSPTG